MPLCDVNEGVLLAFFAALAVFAGLSCAARLESAGRAERALAAAILWLGALCIPVHVLGWLNVLDKASLAIGLSSSIAILLLVAWFPNRDWRTTAATVWDTICVPWDALRETWRERSVGAVGLVVCAGILVWTAWLAYLAPSSSWDGLMYHEGIVGFAIQNHGFRWVEVPPGVVEQVNGFPRTCEYLALIAAILDGKRFMDLVPSAVSPIAILAFYVLLRRVMKDRSAAVAAACALFLIPAIVLQLRSTYVDIEYTICFAACCHFVTRSKLDQSHAWITALAIGLLGGMKVTGLLLAPPLLGIWCLRVFAASWKERDWRFIPTLFVGAASVVGLGGITYLRNWTMQHNVVWPSDLNVDRLNIHWHGPWPISNMQHAATDVWQDLFDLPKPDEQFADSRDNGYGTAGAFLILPLAIFGLLRLVWRVSARVVTAPFRAAPPSHSDEPWLLLLTLVAGGAFAMSPAFWWARLNLHIVVIGFVLAGYLVGSFRSRRLAEAAMGGAILLGAVNLYWSKPRWDVGFEAMRTLLSESERERIAHTLNDIVMPNETARAREGELHSGDVLVVTTHPFVGTLWNEHYTNRVIYVRFHGRAAFMSELERLHAKWVVVQSTGSEASALRQDSAHWASIGYATAVDNQTTAFHRVTTPPAVGNRDTHSQPTSAPAIGGSTATPRNRFGVADAGTSGTH